jgi:dolichol-phosphate mannosyltransferase
VVVPVFNEEGNLAALNERLQALGASSADQYEMIFVDDGSKDGSLEIMRRLAGQHGNVKYLSFSRNFGHEMATTAGLDHAAGDAVVIIDADLQDPPEVIPELVAKWREGFQVVYARRRRRQGESPIKLLLAWLFYRLINALSDCPIPVDTGDFRLMDQCVVTAFRRCRERNRFVRGLVAWTGFRQTAVEYDRAARLSGQTNYGFFKLLHLAFDVVTGFSSVPLRIGIIFGLVVCFGAVIMAAVVLLQKLIWGIPLQGYALLATGLFFLGGIQLLVMGLIGLYVGRLYGQAQERPLYLVREKSAALTDLWTAVSGPTKD